MDKLLKFIEENSKQIFTLLSVILGGTITYISTSITEKKKIKDKCKEKN